MRVLVLGASGMIGRTMFKVLVQRPGWQVIGSVRAKTIDGIALGSLLSGIDLCNPDHLPRLFHKAKPDVVINCAGLTKHLPDGKNPIPALTMNTLLPHRLAEYCAISRVRLIHLSTDCVFSGRTGGYLEDDITDALDLYGKTKALGEVTGDNLLTLRTSTIGHEYGTRFGLLEWFLAQSQCNGFRHAIFSGLPTTEFARVVRDYVIPNASLCGLYHVGAAAIDKFNLLKIIKRQYQTDTKINFNDDFQIDRSLNSEKFSKATGYLAPAWPELIQAMHQDYLSGK